MFPLDKHLTAKMGLFEEIERAWFTVDNKLFLWDYTDGYVESPPGSRENELICEFAGGTSAGMTSSRRRSNLSVWSKLAKVSCVLSRLC